MVLHTALGLLKVVWAFEGALESTSLGRQERRVVASVLYLGVWLITCGTVTVNPDCGLGGLCGHPANKPLDISMRDHLV